MAGQETGVTIGETIPFQVRSSDAERIISPPLSNDPSSWKNLTEQDKEYIVKIGPPKNPKSFPRDSSGRNFPQNIFCQEMTNGEKVTRDWLVWSISSQSLFCFPCCLLQEISQKEVTSKTSKLTKPDLGHGDNWRKLYGKVKAHQQSSSHVSCYITWKELEKNVLRTTGIDQQLQSQFESEVSKWREIFRSILDVVLFLSERQLPFRGSTTELNNPNNGLFLKNLLSGHNKILKLHLDEVKKHQENNSRMQAHCLSPRSENKFISDECSKVVLNAIVEEVKQALHYIYSNIVPPDVSHTEQITFILRYVNLNEKVLQICERFLRMKDCDKKREGYC